MDKALSRTPIFWLKEEMEKIKSNIIHVYSIDQKHYFSTTWKNDFNEIEISFEVKGPSLELEKVWSLFGI